MTVNPDLVAVATDALGWLAPEEGEALYRCALEAPGPIIEIGSYCGKSTVYLGAAAQQAGKLVFAVDHHRGNPEMAKDRECHRPEVMDPFSDRHDTLLHWRHTIAGAGLEDNVVGVVASSAMLASVWSGPVGMLFIDGDHSYEGCRADYVMWAPMIAEGGWLVFHDATIPDIGRVTEEAMGNGFVFMENVGCMRVLRRSAS